MNAWAQVIHGQKCETALYYSFIPRRFLNRLQINMVPWFYFVSSPSTTHLHMAVLIGGGNLTESQTKSFFKRLYNIYAINIDPCPWSDDHFEGNFLQLWKPWAYASFISDVHKSYHVEILVLHHLIFLLIKISKVFIGSKRNFITTANIRLLYDKSMWDKLRLEPINTY